jgi:hypothetical protein
MSKIIELNGIKYKEIPAKTNDKICKTCDYFWDNGKCDLDECPCEGVNTILQRLEVQQ